MESKKNGFEAGQPINTEDSMNDMPTFEDRVRESVPEAIEYLNQHPELKAGIGRATAKLEELNKMLEEGNLEGAEEKNGTFVSAVEAFNATVHANEKLQNKLEDHEIRKLDGEYSEEEYKQAVEETKSQFRNADEKLVEADTTLEYADAAKAIEAAKTKIENLEMAKDEVQISAEEYNAGMAAAKQELADAEARAREAQAVLTANNVNSEDIKSEADKKLDDLEIRKLDGELSEEEYKQAVENIKNNAAKDTANVEASSVVAEAVQARKLAEGKIDIAEKQLDDLDTRHLDGDVSEDEFKSETERLNKIIEESKKVIEDANKQIENSNFEASDAQPAPAAAEAAPTTGSEGDAAAVEATPEDNAAAEAWRAKQDALENDINSKFNENVEAENTKLENAKADLETNKAKLEELTAAGASEETLAKLKEMIAQNEQDIADGEGRIADLNDEHEHQLGNDRNREGSLEDIDVNAGAEAGADGAAAGGEEAGAEGGEDAGEKDDTAAYEKFVEGYINDPDWRAIYTRNGVFDEERCRAALKDMWEAKKKADAQFEAEEAERQAKRAKDVESFMDEGEDEDDDFENENQRGLFNKIKNFFNRNKRVKEGGKNALKNDQNGLRGWKKFVMVAMLSLMAGTQFANFIPNFMNNQNAMNTAGNGVAIETVQDQEDSQEDDEKLDLEDVSDNLSLEVDLNNEKGEELSDLVDTTSYGEDIEVNISYGDFDGSTEFLDYSEKHGRHNLTKELYDMGDESLTNVQKAEQIAEGLANVLDDPIEQGQFAGIGGADVVIGDKVDGITNLNDMGNVLDLAMQDDEFRTALADYNKEMYRDLVDNYDLQVEHRDKGSFHYSLYAYELQLEDGTTDINYAVDKDGVIAQEAFDALQFMDEDGQNVLDKNDIGGYKYNFLKAVGVIPEDATDEEAQDIMSKIRIIGFSGKCGQLIWEHVTPDTGEETTGDEGESKKTSEKTTSEKTTSEKTTSEKTTSEKTTSEKDTSEKTTSEKDTSEKTTSEKTTSEKTTSEKTTSEKITSEKTTNEKVTSEKTTSEKTTSETEYDGKTDVIVDDDDSNDPMGPTQEETGPTDEASRTPVDEGGNGYVNDETPGSSSNLADNNFLNGGDQGGGNTDADGGGSTNPNTEATYDGGDTSGYDNGAQQEEGTQTVTEPSTPEEVNQVNDSNANQNSAGEDQAPGEGAASAMDRLG